MWTTVVEHVRAVVFASIGLALGCATGAFGGAALGAVSMYRAAYGEPMDAVLQMTNRGVNIKWGQSIDEDDEDESEEDYYLVREMDEDESETDTDTDTGDELDRVDVNTEDDCDEDLEEDLEDDKTRELKPMAPPTSLRDALPAMRPVSMRHLRQRRNPFLA